MLRFSSLLAFPFFILATIDVGAESHAHGEHVASIGELVVLHAWTMPARAGEDAVVFFEVENGGEAVLLRGGESEAAATVDVVGASMAADGTRSYQPVGAYSIPGGTMAFDPGGLGLRLNDLHFDLVEGQEVHLHLLLGSGELEMSVEVQPAGATAHSHAGHSH
ncbi:hypothetical protein SAMN06295905_2179 [Devosia lucknowensis]|uniref:Copper(I)-binding protein n=1 Tax=Devosia lucknowensis TaxID=1096929 RepID=A0A1Y6FE64_9HYPH|nr:copper chaperone PCu(A)C [Devosia lucknowensis]SMQ72929.1 hypothetical protein SAMN06295905_2179 [Devosia lucknowensis]